MGEKKNQERLQRVFESVSISVLYNDDEAGEVLNESGLDPEQVERDGVAFIQSLEGKVRLREAMVEREKEESRKEELKALILQKLSSVVDPIQRVKELLTQKGGVALQLDFRKLESVEEEDALEILGEAELLILLEKLEKEGEEDKE